MTLNHIILLLTLGTLAVGCTNDLKFSKGKNGGLDTNPPGVCPVSEPVFVAPPSLVELGQSINLEYIHGEVTWIIRKPDGQIDTLNGNSVSYQVGQVGRYVGKLETSYCGTIYAYDFIFDSFLPVGSSSLIINGGDQYTSSSQVTLSLVSTGATEMYITEDATCSSGGTWEVYNSQKLHTLDHRNQNVNVYAKFRNPVGNSSGCVSDSIIHDDIKPVAQIDVAPNALTNTVSAQFQISATDSGSGVDMFFCSLDSGNVSVCSTTINYTNLNQGSHTFSMRASDKAGNLSDWVQHSWSVDTIKPTLQFTRTPANPTNVATAVFEFTGSDVGSGVDGYECKLDTGVYASCVSPKSVTVTDGSHTYYVRNKDKAGNVSDPISYTWVTDATAPVIQITSAPANPTSEVNADFSFVVIENGVGVNTLQCQLDGAALNDCVSPISYTALVNGSHTFKVVATDKAGNSGSATHTWVVDDKITDQIISIENGSGSADILFVVDNSESMYNELRNSIPYRFDDFIDDLGDLDYQIAVTTSDARGSKPYEAGGFADVLRTPVPGSGIALVPRQKVITPSMPNAANNFIATIMRPEAICTQVGTHLCPHAASPFEQPIYSALQSLDRVDTQFFFRSEVPLHVVIISDTDEGAGTYTYSTGAINNSVIPDHSRPETFIRRVQQKWPGKALKVHSVIRRANERYCNSNANRAYIINILSNQTGGATANICNPNDLDKTEIKAISRAISGGGQTSYTLNCEPKDINSDGKIDGADFNVQYSPQPNFTPDLIVNGTSLRFSPVLPGGTSVSLRYTCK